MTNPASPGRIARDIQLTRALGILAIVGLLDLIVAGIRLAPLLNQEGTSPGEIVAGWLEVLAFLPWPVALVLALDAFHSGSETRARRLRLAGFFAAASFAIESAAFLLSYVVLEAYTPPGYRLALVAAILSRCGLALAAVTLAFAFSRNEREGRERGLDRTFLLIGSGFFFSTISAIYFAIAYSHYPDHGTFTDGLADQAFGAAGVAIASLVAARTWRRSAQSGLSGVAISEREGSLFKVACAFAVFFSILSLGEAYVAWGATDIGYSSSTAAAGWLGVIAGLGSVAAIVCAAIGFRRASRD